MNGLALPVLPSGSNSNSVPEAYIASIIPTPGLTSCSVCGTTGVRCAADASQAKPGQGEALNQAVSPGGKQASNPTGTYTQVSFSYPAGGEPGVSSLPLGENVQGYLQNLCSGNSGLTVSTAPLTADAALQRALAAPASGAFAILGSQDFAIADLSNGTQVMAWLPSDATFLRTAVTSNNGTQLTSGPQYSVGPNGQMIIAADFNGDAIEDLAVSSFGSLSDNTGGNVQIFLGKGDGTFNPGAKISLTNPVSMHAGDFNGDGKVDLAVSSVTANSIQVLMGNGDGTFGAPANYPVPSSPQSVIVMDLNGDGRLDLASVNLGGQVSVLLGNGDGTFRSASSYPAGNRPTYLAGADLNGDGKPDLVVKSGNANSVSLLFGNGDGTFQPQIQYAVGAQGIDFGLALATDGAVLVNVDNLAGLKNVTAISSSGILATPQLYPVPNAVTGIAAADLNGDKFPDMIAADGSISVLLRDPTAQFKAAVNYPLQSGSKAAGVAVGDLNGDGKIDAVASSMLTNFNGSFGGTVDVLLGNGDGTFGHQNSYSLGGYPGGFLGQTSSGIVLADFNGDGKLDVAAGLQNSPDGSSSGGVAVLLGNGDGTLRAAVNYPVGTSSSVTALVQGDFNGDGKPDLVAGISNNLVTPGALILFLGKGDGTFQASTPLQVSTPAGTPLALGAADLNGDGKLDLIVTVENISALPNIVVLLGNGDGTFRQSAPIKTSAGGSAVAIADVNGDGIPDMIIGDCCGLSESVYYLGKGDGTFGSQQFFVSGSSVTGFAVANWNNDGIVGLAIGQSGGTVMAIESGLNPKLGGGSAPPLVLSAAAGVAALAPGSLAAAYGTDLANGQPVALSLPWPKSSEGSSVSITDSKGVSTPALLNYVSAGQVNFQIPDSVATGTATVALTSGDGKVSSAQVTLSPYAPSLFTLNTANLAAAVAICYSSNGTPTTEYPFSSVNGTFVAQALNLGACAQTLLVLYATGMDLSSAANTQVTIGNVAGQVVYAGLQGTWPGFDQINVFIPQSLAGKGNVPVVLTTNGQTSNTVNITIQ